MTQVSGLAPSQMEEMGGTAYVEVHVGSSGGDERRQVGGDVEPTARTMMPVMMPRKPFS